MRLDQIQLAIRPRTPLECLDISFLLCRYHFVGLALTAATAIAPFSAVNYLLWRLPEMNPYLVYLVLSMEIPWAMILVTTYLGQITFTRHVSIRRLLSDALSASLAMFLFQGLVRGLCLLTVFAAPVAFIGMYYLNEIILLEKTPILKTWDRRSAINSHSLGRILSLRLFDLGILCVGTLTLSNFLHAITSLWQGRSDLLTNFADEDSFNIVTYLMNMDWETQAAFWSVIVFLTVYRFVTYLDCRIRREGWDVELKLRAQAAFYDRKEQAV